MKRLAVILVRGEAKVSYDLVHTLRLLRLHRKNTCRILEDTPVNRGMITKVKDFVTWGEIAEETFQALLQKRGRVHQGRKTDSHGKYQYKALSVGEKIYRPYFQLNPPRQGFGRKGIKVAYSVGGALGYRGEKINELIQRMI